MNQKRQLETMFRSGKRIRITQRCTDHTQWNRLQSCCSFHSTQTTTLGFGKSAKAHETHPGKNATGASVRTISWWPGITQDVQHFFSKCNHSQMNRPSLGKTVSA